MKGIATTAMAAILLAGTAGAQPAQRQGQRPPAQAQRPPAQAQPQRPAAPAVPTRVTARTVTALCGQDRGACLTYVLGATDAFSSALVAAGRPAVFCFPRGTTNDQIASGSSLIYGHGPREAATTRRS